MPLYGPNAGYLLVKTRKWQDIEQQALSLAESLGSDFQSTFGVQTALRGIAAKFKVDRVDTYLLDSSALSVRRPDGGVTVLISHLSNRTKFRHSLAHEIGHLILQDICPDRYEHQQRCDPLADPQGLLVEDLCERLALSLLMPKTRLVEYLDLTTPSASNLMGTSLAFDVSLNAASWRYVNLLSCPGAYFHWSISSEGEVQSINDTVCNSKLKDKSIRPPVAELANLIASVTGDRRCATHFFRSLPVIVDGQRDRGLQFIGPFAVETVMHSPMGASTQAMTSFFRYIPKSVVRPL